MKRYAFRISLLMLLGVVTSVAVAWGCAWRVQNNNLNPAAPSVITGVRKQMLIDDGHLALMQSRFFGYMVLTDFVVPERRVTWDTDGIGTLSNIPAWSAPIRATDDYDHRDQMAAGWPLLAVRGDVHLHRGGPFKSTHAIELERWGTILYFPYAPWWPGLLANTAIYGSAWALLLFGPGMFIRWRRRRAGRCAKCGYDLRGSAPGRACPECGAE